MIGLDSTPGFVVFRLTTSTPPFSFRCIYLASRQKVFHNETVASGNHWWHRHLLDPRVVGNITTDPEDYRSSMKQDASIKTADVFAENRRITKSFII